MAQLPTDNGVMAHTEHIRKKRNTAFFLRYSSFMFCRDDRARTDDLCNVTAAL